jgi:hypothetical protein
MLRSRSRSHRVIGMLALLGTAVAGCQGTTDSPTAPSLSVGAFGSGGTAASFGGHGVPLTEVPGSVPAGGAGILNDTQTDQPGFNNFELNVSVHGGPPDTDLFFQFAADVDPVTRGDGVCPGSFPSPPGAGNAIAVLHTSAGGAASAHVKFKVPEGFFGGAFDSGVKVDFKWRLVNATQTFAVQTPCVVLTGK